VRSFKQGKAKEKFLLTDGDLKKLGSLSKSNPQKKEWSAMKLYLLEQVREHRAFIQHPGSNDSAGWGSGRRIARSGKQMAPLCFNTQCWPHPVSFHFQLPV